MEARWVKGYRPKVEADVAYKEVCAIKDANGGTVTAADVVESAAPEASPLHPAFEWNDQTAAHEYRLEQGRLMLRSFRVKVVENNQERDIKPFYAVKPKGEPKAYRTTEDIMQDDEMRAKLLNQVFQKLLALRMEFRNLQELATVWREVDQIQTTLKG